MVYNIWVFNEGICFQFACIMDGCCNALGVSRIICPCGIKFLCTKTRAELKPKLKKINCCYLRWDIVAVQK